MRDSAKWLAMALLAIGPDALTLRGEAALAPGNSLQAVLTSGKSHEYEVQLRAGEYARVVVEQRSVDVSVTCLDPAGNEIFSLDSSVIGDPETAELIADIEGLYRLRIAAAPHSAGGEYEVALREIQPSTERHRN